MLLTIKVTAPDEKHSLNFMVDSDTTISKLKQVIADRINHKLVSWLPELKTIVKSGDDLALMSLDMHSKVPKDEYSVGEYNKEGVTTYIFTGKTPKIADAILKSLGALSKEEKKTTNKASP